MVRVYKINSGRSKLNFLKSLSVNTSLILINIVFFIIIFPLLSLKIIPVEYIAIKPNNILAGKYLWTFLTSMFMHGGLFHIFANMLSLFFVGSLTEKIIGAKRYLYLYLGSGLFAGLFFVIVSKFVFLGDVNTFAVGSSGAIFGIVGFLMLITPDLPVYLMFIPIPIKMKYAAPGILVVLWLISIEGNIPIGNTAHLGGLILGVVYGFYLKKKFPNKINMIKKHFS